MEGSNEVEDMEDAAVDLTQNSEGEERLDPSVVSSVGKVLETRETWRRGELETRENMKDRSCWCLMSEGKGKQGQRAESQGLMGENQRNRRNGRIWNFKTDK